MKDNIKFFLIKLFAITMAVIVVVNVSYNLILAERMEKIDRILDVFNHKEKTYLKDKIHNELNKGLQKTEIINREDKLIILKVYKKIKKEFETLDKNAK
jgi:hypothetical protein|tara:strand:+ start:156 stop:452 length:297 start_codon:yes stop_codon:yes gene_type:complete